MSKRFREKGKGNGFGHGFATVKNSTTIDVTVISGGSSYACTYDITKPPYIHFGLKEFEEYFYRAKKLTWSSDLLYTISVTDVVSGQTAAFSNDPASGFPLDGNIGSVVDKVVSPVSPSGLYEDDVLGGDPSFDWSYSSGFERRDAPAGSGNYVVDRNFVAQFDSNLEDMSGGFGSTGTPYTITATATVGISPRLPYAFELPTFVWVPGVGAFIIPNSSGGTSANGLFSFTAQGGWGTGAITINMDMIHVPRFPGLAGMPDPVLAEFARGGDPAIPYTVSEGFTEAGLTVILGSGGMSDHYYHRATIDNPGPENATGTVSAVLSNVHMDITEYHGFGGEVDTATGDWIG